MHPALRSSSLLALALILISGCGSRKLSPTDKPSASPSASPSVSSASVKGESISFTTLANGNSKVKTAGTRVVGDQADFEQLWKDHSGSSAILPEVDFSKQTVLAVFAGQKPTGGYSIKISSVRLDGKELVVSYHVTSPEKGKLNSQVLTYPAHIVSVASSKTKGDFTDVRFVSE